MPTLRLFDFAKNVPLTPHRVCRSVCVWFVLRGDSFSVAGDWLQVDSLLWDISVLQSDSTS